MHQAYPELEVSRGFSEKMVRLEEERFGSTMTVGLNKLEELMKKAGTHVPNFDPYTKPAPGYVVISDLARLYDTFGTPIDLMYVVLKTNYPKESYSESEHWTLVRRRRDAIMARQDPPEDFYEDMEPERESFGGDRFSSGDLRLFDEGENYFDISTLSEEKFRAIVEEELKDIQKQSGVRQSERIDKVKPSYVALSRRHDSRSKFKGYQTTRVADSRVVALIKDDNETQSLNEGDEGEVVLDRTPFYAESGGQVGDVGRLINPVATAPGTDLMAADRGDLKHAGRKDLIAIVEDTYSPAQGLIVHKIKIEKGTLKVGDTVTAEVDVEKRDATRRNHTATHLMHAALREVLGTHVKQAGSVVAPNYLRFDFSHYQPLTASEIEEIERLVNYHILRNEPVQTDEMAVEEAMRSGAMALFGEKYGEKVRVLSIKGTEGIFSKELCGGTHVRATGDIGVFKITSDESIASGVRRIRAVTGVDAYERFREDEEIIGQVTSNLRTSRAELPAMIGRLQEDLKKARREADELRLKIATGAASSTSSNGDDAREVNGVRVLTREASGLDAAGMRQLSDTLLARIKSGVVVVGRSNDGKASLIVRTSDDLTKKIPAGQVIKELAPIIGGKGGGKADMAEGGGNQPEKLTEALQASYGVVERMLS
jgi:alanyl-tRNA synthetase